MILLIDNYDSFAFNIARYLWRLGQVVEVRRNDDAELLSVAAQAQSVVISPGPKDPQQAGRCIELIRALAERVPMLGICLGHQAIVEAFGGKIVRAENPMHGRATPIVSVKGPLFSQIPENTEFARYHSLIADRQRMPECLEIVAESSCGEVMAVAHRQFKTFGVQFHPESVLSPRGLRLLANFLELTKAKVALPLPQNDFAGARSASSIALPNGLLMRQDAESDEVAPVVLPQSRVRLQVDSNLSS